MNEMWVGAIVMASLIAGLFFLRFWRSTGDRFFLCFAVSFFIEGLSRILLGPAGQDEGIRHYAFYVLRLAAYGLIVFAVWEKNRPKGKDR
jgi:predicted small integral membrane protein